MSASSTHAIAGPPESDEGTELPSAEALVAATLALMTGYAEHCTTPRTTPTAPRAARRGEALPRLLAAKVVSNLFFLAEHPALSAPLRSTLWRLRSHWAAVERGAGAEPAVAVAAGDACGAAASAWLPASATRH